MNQGNVLGFPFDLNERCSPEKAICGSIAIGGTADIDTQTALDIFAYEYFIQLKTADEAKAKTLKLLVNVNNGDVHDSVYARIGQILVAVNAVEASDTYSLRLVNNESQEINYCVQRFRI